MKFDPAIHTKEFLLGNPSVAFELAQTSSGFAKSAIAQDYFILQLRDIAGATVAHYLALKQPDWALTDGANNLTFLEIRNDFGGTVAHLLAFYQPEWIFSKAAFNNEILQLKNNAGRSVAFELISHESCLTHAPIFTKEILTIVNHDNKLLAEGLVKNYAESHDLSVAKMAVKLISLGAAYKHSKIMTVADGQTIFKETKQIIEDCLEPEVAQKIAQALYSTCFHNIERIKLIPSPRGLEKWQSLLKNAEAIMRDVILKHPNLGYSTTKIDFFCEPSADLVSRLKAETLLNNLDTHELNQTEISDDLTINNGLY